MYISNQKINNGEGMEDVYVSNRKWMVHGEGLEYVHVSNNKMVGGEGLGIQMTKMNTIQSADNLLWNVSA